MQNKKIGKKERKKLPMDQHEFFGGFIFVWVAKLGENLFPSVISTRFLFVGRKNCQLGKKSQNWGKKIPTSLQKQGVCHTIGGLAIYIKKYLNAKEELWKHKYFSMQKYNLKKNPLKETKILQDVITI